MKGLNKISQFVPNCSRYFLVFIVPANGQLKSRQPIHNDENHVATKKSDIVKEFEASQWRLEYHLPNPTISS